MSVVDNSQRSNACGGLEVDFYWYHGGGGTTDDHIALAVDALMAAIKTPACRLWNPYNERLTRAMFKKRLEKAAQGKLRPPQELKSLRGADILFEIRWTDVNVHERPTDGPERHITVEVRLIHAQPYDALGLCILGLHAHEKTIIIDDEKATKDIQDGQIDIAERRLLSGRSECWGVTRRR
ncbi:hypothetical protein [Actinomyces ruminis]|uniref:hypothetical protein n=1 Tax=Actinomyces ruminis TaxID=1937003 RepID=UPI00117889F3|nr:hypothetical protein [Actinomyces ruminis]